MFAHMQTISNITFCDAAKTGLPCGMPTNKIAPRYGKGVPKKPDEAKQRLINAANLAIAFAGGVPELAEALSEDASVVRNWPKRGLPAWQFCPVADLLRCTLDDLLQRTPPAARPEIAALMAIVSKMNETQVKSITSYACLVRDAQNNGAQTFIDGLHASQVTHAMMGPLVAPPDHIRHPTNDIDQVNRLRTNDLGSKIGVHHVGAKRK